MSRDFNNAKGLISTSSGKFTIFRLDWLARQGLTNLEKLPFSIRIMLESLLRLCNEREITTQDVLNLAGWQPVGQDRPGLPYRPARVIMQDFTGVPAVVDLAAMRSAVARMGGDPHRINPLVPVDLVVDHSVQVDFYASPDALARNAELEFHRNRERYEFLNWGQKAFQNFRVVPPATGIVHQVNLEYLAKVVLIQHSKGETIAFPDTLVGTDSHTTMINGLGVVGWGVGGIEAEAAMLGQPIDMAAPDVVGFKLTGKQNEGVTATDLTLAVTQMLRKKGVVEKFVEFFGPGLGRMSLADRATIANMAPEYGATMGFFPVDEETLRYLRQTGRPDELIDLVERYTKEQGLFRTSTTADPQFSETLELDLSEVEPSLAGPKRPQDRVPLREMKRAFRAALTAPVQARGYELTPEQAQATSQIGMNGDSLEIGHGAVVIAAITSCTNTSNPSVMVAAGLLAKAAVEKGLRVKPFVKTSLAPGSRVVTEYLQKAGLLKPLAELGFNVVGYGCTTCIGNSGPLPEEVVKAIRSADLVAAAVLSGNRNFEGRVHPFVRANYLASPPLVVAFALAGTVEIDLSTDCLGLDRQGNPVYLRDIWPEDAEIRRVIEQTLSPDLYREKYKNVFTGNLTWNAIGTSRGMAGDGDEASPAVYAWDSGSTYVQEPPFFIEFSRTPLPVRDILDARVLAFLGDSITTDHISPAGSIPADASAGKYLIEKGVNPKDFNSYGARRGNDQVMTRGTFANIRLKNKLVPGVEGGVTVYFPKQGGAGSRENTNTGGRLSIFDAAMRYRAESTPLIILAGKEYGSGSSRDWAAKGTLLLGVKAVLAESYERIHRSNLVGMGVLPLQFLPGENPDSLGLDGSERYSITGLAQSLAPNQPVVVSAAMESGKTIKFSAVIRLNTAVEVEYYQNGGILQTVLRKML